MSLPLRIGVQLQPQQCADYGRLLFESAETERLQRFLDQVL